MILITKITIFAMTYLLLLLSIAAAWATVIVDNNVFYPDSNVVGMILNDGNSIPGIGLGTFAPVSEEDSVKQAIIDAIDVGYRLINTAFVYNNEEIIGQAINEAISCGSVTRENLFITAGLDMTVGSREEVIPALQSTLRTLQLDYIDLYLLRFPFNQMSCEENNIVPLWQGMEMTKDLGLAKSIGVSNFNSSQINTILANTKTRPAVNQIEVNPTSAELELVAYCQQENIIVMGYAPFGFLVSRPFNYLYLPPTCEDETLMRLGRKYGKSIYQIVLRYLIDRGIIPLPRSLKESEIQEDINVYDFQLNQEEIFIINEFNENRKVYPFNNPEVDEALNNYIYGTNGTDCY